MAQCGVGRYMFGSDRTKAPTRRGRRRLGRGRGSRRRRLFLDAGGSAGALAEVVELGATDGAAGDDLEAVDARAVHRERALDADAGGRLPHRERLAMGAAAPLDDGALEDLDALLVALDDADVDPNRVARLEGGYVRAKLLGLDPVDGVHGEAALSTRLGATGQG